MFVKDYTTLYEIIYDYYETYRNDEDHWTCYIHLKCNRKYAPVCLNWSEICDGRIYCLDGDFDERHCWQLEVNECKQNEHQCSNGLCIPKEFSNDDSHNPDCLDGTDENGRYRYEISEVTFEREDVIGSPLFITSSPDRYRHQIIVKSMFSNKDPSVSNKNWSAFKCYFGLSNPDYPTATNQFINNVCVHDIEVECPFM
ncbi:hypothetical protein I4U23_022935 [Adineta vaga]|nr:hypothetical protein I4U23_022935 [Adineta vaga]